MTMHGSGGFASVLEFTAEENDESGALAFSVTMIPEAVEVAAPTVLYIKDSVAIIDYVECVCNE